jgi:hypothetical protein
MKVRGPAKRKRLQKGRKKARKVYETPKLTKFGSIAELTQGGAGAGADPLVASAVTG